MSTWVTLPLTCWLGRALKVTVAGWPTLTWAASDSSNPPTTCRLDRLFSVMNAELDPELDDELLELDELDELDGEEAPPPLTVWPTIPVTAATVPAIGAVRVMLASAFWADSRFAWLCAREAWAWATLVALTSAFTLLAAWVDARPLLAELMPFWAWRMACWSLNVPEVL